MIQHSIARVAAVGILAIALSPPAIAQNANTADAEFEAALQAARTTVKPTPAPISTLVPLVPDPVAGRMSPTGRPRLSEANRSRIKHIPLPPADTIPTQFRGPPSGRTAFEAARDAMRRGELDPFAYAEQISGPMPLPPGGRAMRCRIWGMEAMYTLGREASPEVSSIYAAYERAGLSGEKPNIKLRGGEILPANNTMRALLLHQHASDRPENRKILRDLTTFLEARGFEGKREFLGDMTFIPKTATVGRATVKLTYYHSPFYQIDICRKAGLTMPTGPYVVAEPFFPEPKR